MQSCGFADKSAPSSQPRPCAASLSRPVLSRSRKGALGLIAMSILAGVPACTAFVSMGRTALLRQTSMPGVSHQARSLAQTIAGISRPRTPAAVFCSAASGGGGGRASAAVVQDAEKQKGGGGKQEKLDLQPPRGTRDFYPEDMRLRNWLFGHWKDVAREYGFEEYDAPVLESEALYIRKAGEEVTQQLYNFEDKGERRVALRPEMTPSLARMVMSKGKGLTLPVKWASIPQCWRYERMTRGRRREHYQWNMDIWGIEGVEAEAELLSAIVSFFSRVGVTSEDVGIKVNSRAVLSEVLLSMGVSEDKHAATCVLVDKLEKVKIDDIRSDMEALGLTEEIIDKLLKTLAIRDINELVEALESESPALKQLQQLFQYAEAYGFQDWLVFDASVVRGLAYYTGVVFEAFDRSGELRAICGGGRYDKLLESFGGEALPACGFGFGDAVIVELLKDKNLLPDFSSGSVDAVVFPFNAAQRPAAAAVASALRKQGIATDLVLESKKTKWLFKHADRVGARCALLIGDSEVENGTVQVKDLGKGEQEQVPMAEVAEFVQKLL